MSTKQVIVMRKDLNMRKGKMIAQGAHASVGAILIHGSIIAKISFLVWNLLTRPALRSWLSNSFAKICVGADSEKEVLEIYTKARQAGLLTSLITDSGRTEFNGVQTITCCAIGPGFEEEINKITGHLKLL